MTATTKDLLAAAPDALRAAFGAPVRNPHPLAAGLSEKPLATAALICGRNTHAGRDPNRDDRQVMAYGLQTSEFGQLLSEALAPVAAVQFATAAEHRRFCRVIEVANYKPARLPGSIAGNVELPAITESQDLTAFDVRTTDGATARLHRYGASMMVTAEAVINDLNGAIRALTEQMASAAARRESEAVYGALESDAPMEDSELPFHTDHGNVIAAALDATSLGQAIAAIRTQKTLTGNIVDLGAAHLLTAPDIELSAKKLLHESGLSQQITVTSSGQLPTGRWYLLTAPEVQPVVGVLTLRGSNGQPIAVGTDRTPIQLDGLVLRVTASVGAALLARVGVVRGGA